MDKYTEQCYCTQEDGEANRWCEQCDGTGVVMTQEGRELIHFVRKWLLKDLD